MFSAVSAYIKNIALIMLLVIFAEIAVPNDKVKKYVSVIAGLILMFAIAGRLIDVMGAVSKGEVDIPVFSYQENKADETENITDRLTDILYDEMDEVDNNNEDDDSLDIKVEDVLTYS